MIRKLAKKKHALLVAVVIGAAACGQADAADSIQTRDVVVTASRTEQEVKETPAAVEVITKEDIEKMGAENLAQALQLATGINVLENGMVGNQSSLRGMNTNQTLILIDGRRVRTENTSETQNYYELQRVNMDRVERVEIVRGAVSSLYGSEALGGVINIITKKPGTQGGTVSADWTSRQKDAGFRYDLGKNGKWAWAMNGKVSDIKRRMSGASSNQYGKKYFFGLDGRMDVAANKQLDFFADFLYEDLYMIDSAAAGTDYDHRRASTGLKYSGKDKQGDYEMQVYYTYFDKDQRTRNRNTNALTSFDDMTFNSYVADGRRTFNLGDQHILTVGGEYRQEDYESTRIKKGNARTVTREGITNNISKVTMDYGALYLQDEFMVTNKWLLIPSVRWDHNNDFGDEVTGKLGTTYKLSKNARFKANVGSAYRAPTASELYFNWQHTPTAIMTVNIQGNPDLKPEKSLNFDLGLEAEHGNTSGKFTYFHNKVDDLINLNTTITRAMVPGAGMRMTANGRYENVDKATVQGLELEAKQKLGKAFTLRSTYTYLDARDDSTNAFLTGRARHKTSLQLMYVDAQHGWDATLWNDWLTGYHYTESSKAKETGESIMNLVVNKKFNKTVSAYFGINNLTNRKNDVLYYDGRIWRGGVKVNF
ncbi:putative TonB-dependent receptor protein [Selenomonas ruminantium subsp. lactilytica TAM6421]|uniref:Putative TonB-dependent receptor protein n=1 Tax=Selenomonas ruminantium subsp. lactilytica (strain NBRC 103574 / TAM6421) TaxID=927704 RepID=I0GQ48_SELRL|nr:TonB-dependent receptor [Selenomonas ruminantium]BAL82885.1 putative TonB-dependent receptor protein [Selenomonas ruminantium subsp. lactilytica TAM6421]